MRVLLNTTRGAFLAALVGALVAAVAAALAQAGAATLWWALLGGCATFVVVRIAAPGKRSARKRRGSSSDSSPFPDSSGDFDSSVTSDDAGGFDGGSDGGD